MTKSSIRYMAFIVITALLAVIFPLKGYTASFIPHYEDGGLELYDGSDQAKALYDSIKNELPKDASGNI